MSSSARTRDIKNSTILNGYSLSLTLTERINKGCNIIEVPFLKHELVGHKVIITDGKIPTRGIVIRPGYLYFFGDMPVYYIAGAKIYILTEKYKINDLITIYSDFITKLADVMYYIKTIKGASINVSMTFDSDYVSTAGTPSLNDDLDVIFSKTLADAMGIPTNRVVVTGINSGSVVISFTIIESQNVNDPTPVDVGENLRYQLGVSDSKLYANSFMKTAKSISVIKNLSVTNPDFYFMRDYNVQIYEKIMNENIDVLGNIFKYLNINII